MGVFGPKYPSVLQVEVNHAERFSAVLATLEALAAPRVERARAWLCGRSDEVQAFATCVAADWRDQRIGVQAAAAELGAYLARLHDGTRVWLGTDLPLSCCAPDVSPTVLLAAGGVPSHAANSALASEESGALEGEVSHASPADA